MLSIAAIAACGIAWLWLRRPPARPSVPSPASRKKPVEAPGLSPAGDRPLPPIVSSEPLPAELGRFVWRDESRLEAARRDAMIAAVRGIPRPPSSLQQLLSPEFVAKAGSGELSELVMTEPLIAARVISTVNAPFYGLHKPVGSIGQAVTFLGINSVRNICLQYMLAEAFKPTLAEAQKAFDAIWKASAIAAELATRLGKTLNLPDQGAMSTQVVLGFVGQLATASLIPAAGLPQWLARNRLERARLEQELLGLSAGEIGRLLMNTWELPPDLIADVADTGRLLVTPVGEIDNSRVPRLALAYLSGLLGERLAGHQLASLDGYVLANDPSVDTHHLRACLAHPALSRLQAALEAPELLKAVQQMTGVPVSA